MKVTTRLRSTQYQNWMLQGKERTNESVRLFKERGPPIVMTEMRQQIPLGKTGQTRETVNSRETPYGFTVYSNSPIAKFLDQGTQPHIILPKTEGGVLRWFGPWGNPIFARSVKHPGTKPTYFVKKTVDAVRDQLRDLLNSIWREVHGIS